MADALYFTDDPEACELLAQDPFALLIGFAIDQQVPVQKAFAGPLALKQRVGTLDPRSSRRSTSRRRSGRSRRSTASPARWPAACASSRRSSTEDYGGDASRIWSEAKDTADLKRRLGALPGFGPMKVTALASVLALRLGVAVAKPLVPNHACLGGVDSPQALLDYQAAKRAHKAELRAAAKS